MADFTSLLQQAAVIRDASQEKENTAQRVGTMFVDILQRLALSLPARLIDASVISSTIAGGKMTVTFNLVNQNGATSTKDIIIPAASASSPGLMQPTDKTSLQTALNIANAANDKALANEQRINTLVGNANATAAIDSFNEVIAFLNGITNTDSLAGLLNTIRQTITEHSDAIDELQADVPGKADDFTVSEELSLSATRVLSLSPAVKNKIDDAGLIAAAQAAGAVYNEATGYFELNTLTDITAEQMRKILYSPDCHIGGAWQVAKNIRTNLTLDIPTLGWTSNEAKPLEFIVYVNNTIEVLKLTRSDGNIWVNKLFHAFRGAPKLRVIIGKIQAFTAINAESAFNACPALEEVRIGRFYSNLDFSDCPKLSLASLTHMVQHGAPDLTPTKSITYTLHPEAYARLTPALISEAAAKYISFATT